MKERTRAWMEFAARDLEAAKRLTHDEYLANIITQLATHSESQDI